MDHHLHDGPSGTTVLVVGDPIPKGLTLFLSVLLRTSTTDRHTLNGPSCTTVMVVKDPCPSGIHTLLKCPLTNLYDGLSSPRRTVLHNRHGCQKPCPEGLPLFLGGL